MTDANKHVSALLPVPLGEARAYLVWAGDKQGIKVRARYGGGADLSLPWRPGKPYWGRPVIVVTFEEAGSGSRVSGVVTDAGRVFRVLWWAGTVVAALVVLITWGTAALHLWNAHGNVPASILLVPVGLAAGGAALFYMSGIVTGGDRERLVAFLNSIDTSN